MKWNAAACLLASLAVSPTPAQAATVLVTQLDDHRDDVEVTSFAFGENQAPDRAWVNLDVYRRAPVDIPEIDQYSVVRAWVPGLSRVGDQILFTSGSRTTLCATVVHKRFLFIRYDDVEKTGRCTVTTAHDVRRLDDGFAVKTIPVVKVYFNARE
jgi:hypothetical protein